MVGSVDPRSCSTEGDLETAEKELTAIGEAAGLVLNLLPGKSAFVGSERAGKGGSVEEAYFACFNRGAEDGIEQEEEEEGGGG